MKWKKKLIIAFNKFYFFALSIHGYIILAFLVLISMCLVVSKPVTIVWIINTHVLGLILVYTLFFLIDIAIIVTKCLGLRVEEVECDG